MYQEDFNLSHYRQFPPNFHRNTRKMDKVYYFLQSAKLTFADDLWTQKIENPSCSAIRNDACLRRSEKQEGHPVLWLTETFSTSPLNPLNRIQRNLTGSKISRSSTKFVGFFGRSENQDGRPGPWLVETFSTSPLKMLNGNRLNLTGSKISESSTMFVFFGPIGKTRWPPWPLIGWDIFDFSSEIVERQSTKLHRKQNLNVLYQVYVFRADRKHKMSALASDCLRHFRLLLWNRWTEVNETWQKARSQSPLPSLCFSGRSEK